MPTPTKGPRFGGSPAHQRLMLANLATALFEHGRITTTQAKAKRLRPLAERMITFAKRGDLHARRQVLTVVRDRGVVHSLFAEIGPRYSARNGGYTRITKIGPRKGDNAAMAVIELVEEAAAAPEAAGTSARRRPARRGAARKAAPAAAETQLEAPEAEAEPAATPRAEANGPEADQREADQAEVNQPEADHAEANEAETSTAEEEPPSRQTSTAAEAEQAEGDRESGERADGQPESDNKS